MMLQRVAAGIVGGVLMSAVLVAPAASAVTDSEAKANMLNETEVPAIFGKAKDYDFNSKVIGKSIGICGTPEGKTLVSVPAPSSQFVVDIETRTKRLTPTSWSGCTNSPRLLLRRRLSRLLQLG